MLAKLHSGLSWRSDQLASADELLGAGVTAIGEQAVAEQYSQGDDAQLGAATAIVGATW